MCNMTREASSLRFTTDAVQVAQLGTGAQQAQQAIGADSDRRGVTVISDADNAGDVYVVGDPSMPYTRGVRLKPGAGVTISSIAPVYVISPNAVSKVYVLAESGAAL